MWTRAKKLDALIHTTWVPFPGHRDRRSLAGDCKHRGLAEKGSDKDA